MRELPEGVEVTGGGKWDPEAENIFFLAGTVSDAVTSNNPFTLLAVNEIKTQKQIDLLDRWCDERTILLDSGVYALASAYAKAHDVSIGVAFATPPDQMDDWNRLYDQWCELTQRFGDRLWGVIELDQGGKDAARITREACFNDTGIMPIPVYHPLSDGWDYYDELAQGYDRICVGGLALPPPARLRLCWTACDRARAYPYLWTHLLSITPAPWVLSAGLRGSVDSSSWLAAIRWATTWQARVMLQRFSTLVPEMTYDRDDPKNLERGRPKAMQVSAAYGAFQQETFRAVVADTHGSTR